MTVDLAEPAAVLRAVNESNDALTSAVAARIKILAQDELEREQKMQAAIQESKRKFRKMESKNNELIVTSTRQEEEIKKKDAEIAALKAQLGLDEASSSF